MKNKLAELDIKKLSEMNMKKLPHIDIVAMTYTK